MPNNGTYGSASDYTTAKKIRTIVTSNLYAGTPNIQLASRVLLPPTLTQRVHNTFAVRGAKIKMRGRA